MKPIEAPWILPGLSAWLDRIADRLDMGIAALPVDPLMPPGALEALTVRRDDLIHTTVIATPGRQPAEVLGEAFGTHHHLEALLDGPLDQEMAIVDLQHLRDEDLQSWNTFLARFKAARIERPYGLVLLLTQAPEGLELPAEGGTEDWRAALRRGDRVIWAESHLPASRSGTAGELAVSLAVELCAWRLDLAMELVRAGVSDLADPLQWLATRVEAERGSPPGGMKPDACPCGLFAAGEHAELSRRIWHAQLVSLFPILEEERQALVVRYGKYLRVDSRQAELGVTSVEEIELGALNFQLRGVLSREENDALALLARIRNDLAHRKPADPDVVRALLKMRQAGLRLTLA